MENVTRGFKFMDLAAEFRSDVRVKSLQRELYIINPIILSPEKEKSIQEMISESNFDQIEYQTTAQVRYFPQPRKGPASYLINYELFVQDLWSKLLDKFPQVLHAAKRPTSKSQKIAVEILSCKWFIDQVLFHAKTESPFRALIKKVIKKDKLKKNNPPLNICSLDSGIYRGMKTFFDKYISGLRTNNAIVGKWANTLNYLNNCNSESLLFNRSIFDSKWYQNLIITSLDSTEAPQDPFLLFFALNIYLSDSEFVTFREAVHFVEMIQFFKYRRKWPGALISLYYHLLYKSIRRRHKSERSIRRLDHDPYLRLLSRVMDDKLVSPDKGPPEYFKRYYDFGWRFEKHVYNLQSKHSHVNLMILDLKKSFNDADLSCHEDFTNMYMKLIKMNPELIFRSPINLNV